MSGDVFYFTCERLMGLFWVLIQQFCFVCIKYAHDDIVTGDGKGRHLLIQQGIVFFILIFFCFQYELGFHQIPLTLFLNGTEYFPWTVRIILCGAMILFDSLLVLYFFRIVRVYRYGLGAARPTKYGDLIVLVFVAVLCAGYLYASISASLNHNFSMAQYNWIGRFFIQLANFFYIALEVSGALMAWKFLQRLRTQEGRRNAG